jgi:hypothetical protein
MAATNCRGKIRYDTQRAASTARQSLIRRKDRNPGSTGKVNIYACHDCDGWHIGHERRYVGDRPKRGGDRVLTKLARYRELAGQ